MSVKHDMESPDVVVVGAGAIGAASAHALARRGARVTVLERSHVSRGCSYGNAGLICPSHAQALASPEAIRDGLGWLARRDSPFHLRPRPGLLPWLARFAAASLPRNSTAASAALRALAGESLELHARQAALGTSFARRGILSAYLSPRAFAAACRTLPAGARTLSGAEARELEPALAPGLAGVIHHPSEAHCDPAAYVSALLGAGRELGVDVRPGVEILRLRCTGGRVEALETTAGTVRAGAVVLAAGVWTRDLAAGTGVRVPLEAGKGYHVELDRQPLTAGMPVYMEDARVVATPLDGRLRVSGTLELSGLDTRVDPVRLGALERAARRFLAIPERARRVQVWRGLRPCAPDGLPVIGPAGEVANLFLATAHAMLGITLAPITAEILAGHVCDERPRPGAAALSPARFSRGWR